MSAAAATIAPSAEPRPWVAPAERSAPATVPASLEEARRRLTVAVLLFLFAVSAVSVRLGTLALSDAQPDARGAAVAARGSITDRHGAVLAQGYNAYALALFPTRIIGDSATLAPRIAAALGVPVAEVERDLAPTAKFRYLARRLSPSIAAKVIALGEPAIELHREPDRVYPNVALAAQLLGTVDREGHGQSGAERAFDVRLADGMPVALSIDARVQQAMESELAAAMLKHSAIAAGGVVMDAATGEVLALASLPTLNPNAGTRGDDPARINHAAASVYELGSIFKPLTIAMALDAGATKLTDVYDASRPLRVARFTIRDFRGKKRALTVPEVLVYSSNIGTAQIAERVGPVRQRAALQQLGLLDRLPVELVERGKPLYPEPWSRLATMTVGFGHGIAVSPLHMAAAYSAIANGGTWRSPTLVKLEGEPAAGRRVFTEATSATMRRLMRLVVLKGSGTKANAIGYRVAGKTGTADKARAGGYNRNNRVATFAGFFPADAPRYVVVAMLDSPQATKDTYGFATAGWTAAPAVNRLVGRIAPALGVAPSMTKDVESLSLLPGQHERIEE